MIDFFSSLHPFFVYFTIGLLGTSAVLYLVGFVLQKQDSKKTVQTMALWLLWGGAGVTVLAIASGFWAYSGQAPDDTANLAVKGHRNWAIGTALLFFALAGWTWSFVRKGKMIPFYFPTLLLIGAVLIGITGWKGGDLVSSYGSGSTPIIDAPPPEETVAAFHASLNNGEGDAAMAFLENDVLIYESGYVEKSAQEYADHHLSADMEFLAGMTDEIISSDVKIVGRVATVVSEIRTFGRYNDQDFNLAVAETMILVWDGTAWKITHIHWSSHPIEE